MIVIYGRPGCGACENVKMLLSKKNIQFHYIDLTSLDEPSFDMIMEDAGAAGIKSLPIISKDGKITILSEVLK